MRHFIKLLIAGAILASITICQADTLPVKSNSDHMVVINKQKAIALCNKRLKNKAQYGYRSSLTLALSFQVPEKEGATNYFWFVIIPVHLQNASGAYQKINGFCAVNPRGKKSEVMQLSTQLVTDAVFMHGLPKALEKYDVNHIYH